MKRSSKILILTGSLLVVAVAACIIFFVQFSDQTTKSEAEDYKNQLVEYSMKIHKASSYLFTKIYNVDTDQNIEVNSDVDTMKQIKEDFSNLSTPKKFSSEASSMSLAIDQLLQDFKDVESSIKKIRSGDASAKEQYNADKTSYATAIQDHMRLFNQAYVNISSEIDNM